MEMPIAKLIHDLGQELSPSTNDLAKALNQSLNQILGWGRTIPTGLPDIKEPVRTHPFTTTDPRSNPASIFCRPA
jgi:hypothetical protein